MIGKGLKLLHPRMKDEGMGVQQVMERTELPIGGMVELPTVKADTASDKLQRCHS